MFPIKLFYCEFCNTCCNHIKGITNFKRCGFLCDDCWKTFFKRFKSIHCRY